MFMAVLIKSKIDLYFALIVKNVTTSRGVQQRPAKMAAKNWSVYKKEVYSSRRNYVVALNLSVASLNIKF